MFTIVALLEACSEGSEMFSQYTLNDGTARVTAKKYQDQNVAEQGRSNPQPGQYVRLFGFPRTWNNELQITHII